MTLGPAEIALLVVVGIVGLYMAWNIGANDVANALGTSVGSHAVSLKQAILIAAVFEFAGAVIVGGNVTETIRKGMLDVEVFAGDPMVLVYGMAAALLASGIWIQIATAVGWPVSTTHSIVGGVIGFGVVAGGVSVVNWAKVGAIAASWVISPVMGGLLGFVVFWIVRNRILDTPYPVKAVRRYAPWFMVPIFYVLTLAMFFKGLKNLKLDVGFGTMSLIGLAVGGVAAWITWLLIRRVKRPDDAGMEEAYELIEKRVFRYLQIITACFVAFAHGSNDVANAVGPMAAIYAVMTTGAITMKSEVPMWMLLVGGTGIVIGLATWGYKVIATIGTKITEMTPTRGFSAEFGAALTIILGSKLGLPLSTTHVLVGAVIGVGFARGIAGLNLGVVRSIGQSWIITLPFCAILSMILFFVARAVFG